MPRDQGEQHDYADRPPPKDLPVGSEEERDVPGEVEGGAAAERDCRHRVELLADVTDRRLQAECEEDDPGDHRQVEVAVGVQRKPVQLQAPRLHEPPPHEDRGDVEVEPPERRNNDDSKHRRRDHARTELEPGAEPDGDDRLAERDDDNQPVPLGEVLRRDPPAAAGADHDRAEVVDGKRDEPDRNLLAPVEEACDDEQGGTEDAVGANRRSASRRSGSSRATIRERAR